MLYTLFALALIAVAPFTNAQITPIINSTGEYFIAPSDNSWQNQDIVCNSSISNCYIICQDETACMGAKIQCPSANCNIECNTRSCRSINVDLSDSISTQVTCMDQDACNSMMISTSSSNSSAQQIAVSNNSSLNIMCKGEGSCSESIIQTNHAMLNIDCQGTEPCQDQIINSRNNTLFTYQCYKNATSASGTCLGSQLKVSPNAQSTEIVCSGIAYSASCDSLGIYVPLNYNGAFIDFKYVNNSGDDIPAGDQSAADITLQCEENGNATPCTNDVTFPIIGTVEPDVSNSSGDYYTNPSGYAYRFKEINSKAGNETSIECIGDQSCYYVSIKTQGLYTSLTCNTEGVCENVVLETLGEDVSIECDYYLACSHIDMLQSSASNVTISCDGTKSSGETAQTACHDFSIKTKGNINLHCGGDHGCEDFNLDTGGALSMTCNSGKSDDYGCQSFHVDAEDGALIECLGKYSCSQLNADVAGTFTAICSGSYSCERSSIDVSGQTYPHHFHCVGDDSCNDAGLQSESSDVIIDCHGCEETIVKLLSNTDESNLQLTCDKEQACDRMSVQTLGSVALNCTDTEACLNLNIHPPDNSPDEYKGQKSTISCKGDKACNNLGFTVATDILVDCNLMGDSVCGGTGSTTTIQSTQGYVTANCASIGSSGNNTNSTNSGEACKEMTIVAKSNIDLTCSGDEACSGIIVMGGNELILDCTGSGNAICNNMNINMTNKIALNEFKCGGDGNTSSPYSCANTTINTYSNNVIFDCKNGGCAGIQAITNNDDADIKMICQGYEACLNMDLTANGNISSLACQGSNSCQGAKVTTFSGILSDVYCTAVSSCVGLEVDSPRSLSFVCNGETSCEKAILKGTDITMHCNENEACNGASIFADGNLMLDCTGGGLSNCGEMTVKTIDSTASTQILCGGNSSSTTGYSCASSNIDSSANNISIQCVNGGCSSMDVTGSNGNGTMSLKCEHAESCYDITVRGQGKIDVNCIGSKSCDDANLFATGDMLYNCDGSQACEGSTVNANGGLQMNCAGSMACNIANVISHGELVLNCTGNGAVDESQCRGIQVSELLYNSSNTFLCGRMTNNNGSNACTGAVFDTHSKNVKLECSTVGCNDATVINENQDSSLMINCNDIFACNGMKVDTEGELVMKCMTGDSCKESVIGISHTGDDSTIANIECNGDTSCQSMVVISSVYLLMNCNGDSSCKYSNITTDGILLNGTGNTVTDESLFGGFQLKQLLITSNNTLLSGKKIDNNGATVNIQNGHQMMAIDCGGEYGCNSSMITASTGSTLSISCDSNYSCNALNIQAPNVMELTIYAGDYDERTGQNNVFTNSMINVSNATNVNIQCKGLCSENEIQALTVKNLDIYCSTKDLPETDKAGCHAMMVNAINAGNVGLHFYGKYATRGGMFEASHAKNLTVLQSAGDVYDTQDKNELSLIYGPTGGLFSLECRNFGCYFGNYKSDNGLSDINATFTGCNCTVLEDCANIWQLTCPGNETNSFIDGKCESDSNNCCDTTSATTIEDRFDTQLKSCGGDNGGGSGGDGLSGGAIAGIIIGILIFIIIIAGGGYYYYKNKKCEEPLLVND